MVEQLLSPKQVAERWGVSVETVHGWRYQGIGPTFMNIGTRIRYRMQDLIEFERREAEKTAAVMLDRRKRMPRSTGNPQGDEPREQKVVVRDVATGLRLG